MTDMTWVRSPVEANSGHWSTRRTSKAVLVLVPHIVAGARLLDLLPLLEADHRIQVVFTVPEPWESWRATEDFVREQGGIVLPWAQARRGEYDLVLAGSTRGIDETNGPVLLVPHGGGFAQYRPWRPPGADRGWTPLLGLDPDQLMREGRLRADAVVLTHDRELEILTRTCPPAVPTAIVAGDIAFDRLAASLPFRHCYRRAFGVPDDRQLVVVTSTWSGRSAFGRYPDLFERIMADLPSEEYQVAGALHPQIWSHHGYRQVRAWLGPCLRDGLKLLAPDEGWRAALVAADHLIGDYGSTTGYAAGIGRPVLLASDDTQPLLPGTPTAVLAEHAPRWQPHRPLVPQLKAAQDVCDAALISSLLTSRPGGAGAVLRATMYRLLGLNEPACALPVSPVAQPRLLS